MKYWKIDVLSLNSEFYRLGIIDILKNHLQKRKYKYFENKFISLDNYLFEIKIEWNEDTLFVTIYNLNDWNKTENPQIVELLSDYFIMNSKNWYLIEIINSYEDLKIKEHKRKIEPLQIIEKLRNLKTVIPKKPKIIDIGTYVYQQTDLYYAEKAKFNILDFWISCLYWVDFGSFEKNELLDYYINNSFFDNECGYCLPLKTEEIEEVTKYIGKKSSLKNPTNCYQMRKTWYDLMYIIEYEDIFILYNWYTAE